MSSSSSRTDALQVELCHFFVMDCHTAPRKTVGWKHGSALGLSGKFCEASSCDSAMHGRPLSCIPLRLQLLSLLLLLLLLLMMILLSSEAEMSVVFEQHAMNCLYKARWATAML